VRPEAEVQLVAVESTADAEAMRFLGSPSIRVDGHDVESGADERRDYTFGCRLHATAIGLRPLPSERWLRDALEATASAQPSIISASSVDTVSSEADTRRSTGL
jgi:hypothetical protein